MMGHLALRGDIVFVEADSGFAEVERPNGLSLWELLKRGNEHFDHERTARHQVRGLIAFGIGLALTSGALAALHASAPQASRAAELTVLVAANLTATLVRFGLYRSWVFRAARGDVR